MSKENSKNLKHGEYDHLNYNNVIHSLSHDFLYTFYSRFILCSLRNKFYYRIT